MTDLKIDWASHQAASYSVKNWHYSETLPVQPILKIGVWEDKKFIGVVLFSRGGSPHLLKAYGLTQTEGCELTRIALTKHKTEVTKIVKIAILFVKKKCPKIQLIISFADPEKGHHGGVYQGGNWFYVGDTKPSKEYYFKGKRIHNRYVSPKGKTLMYGSWAKCYKPSELDVRATLGKHKYLMPLTKEMKNKIKPLAKPYPKKSG